MKRRIIAVITDILGDRVIVGETELQHSIEDHFTSVPQDIVLELMEKVLKDPTEIYRDDLKKQQIFNFFYRLDAGPKYLVAVIKITPDGAFFASMYPTGKTVRNKHKKYRKVKI